MIDLIFLLRSKTIYNFLIVHKKNASRFAGKKSIPDDW